jgi:glucose-1-phosphate cytidylyltransferase
MKVVILAGGLGTRLAEETSIRPKPMVEIGQRPILWHIMKIYAHYGFSEFIVCCGYKGYVIKEYFSNHVLHDSDVTFDLKSGNYEIHHREVEPWTVTLVDTGDRTQTGGRIARVARYLDGDAFGLTYGDAVSDVDIRALVELHRREGRLATVTAVLPPARFGALDCEGNRVVRFQEKPAGGDAWINGGFFVLSPSVIDYIDGDDTVWEREPLERLTAEGQLTAYFHGGFWQPMDTLRDKYTLEGLWEQGNAPWKLW